MADAAEAAARKLEAFNARMARACTTSTDEEVEQPLVPETEPPKKKTTKRAPKKVRGRRAPALLFSDDEDESSDES